MNTPTRQPLIDELIETYVDWHEACARVHGAYRFWAGETNPRSRVAFALYRVALDEEQRTAEVYAGVVRRADELPWTTDDPARSANYASCDSVTGGRDDLRSSPNERAA